MSVDPRTPVIVGAGQVVRHDGSCEPAAMIVEALREAGLDSAAGERLLRRADSVRCVPVIAWPYSNVAALVAEDLGARPRETVLACAVGGDGPQRLINDTCAAIAAGQLEVALLGGAEAVAALRAAQLAGGMPPWRSQGDGAGPTRVLDEARDPLNDVEKNALLHAPVFMYALLESAVRAASGSGRDEHAKRIAGLWSRFSAVAETNPHAWIRRSYAAEEIATPGSGNRLVSTPYTKLLTANMQVNMATGLIVCSAQAAQDAGVPKDRWVFVHAGAQAEDEWHVSERAELFASPAIRAVGTAVLEHAGVEVDEVAHVDLYSCFPSAVQIAASELGLAIDDSSRPLTVTGGLTFAGGPGNNYTSHAVATLVGRLRSEPDSYGLATALGWYLTKHAAGVYSARPPRRQFASIDARPQRPRARRTRIDPGGPATIEACTVVYERDGSPQAAIISALTRRGERTVIRTSDPDMLQIALDAEPIGRQIDIGLAA
jgi:acetyl-CoA C-acetyltransferase